MGFNILKILYVNLILVCNTGYKYFTGLFNVPSKEIVKEVEKPTNKLKKVPTSILHLVPRDYVEDNNSSLNFKLNPQAKDKCSCCNSKLTPSQKQYFAFDKEYCYRCWNKINLN